MKEVFKIQNPAYNFRSEATHFKSENVKTTHYGIQSVGFFLIKNVGYGAKEYKEL